MRAEAHDELARSLLEILHENTKETSFTFTTKPIGPMGRDELPSANAFLLPPLPLSRRLGVSLQQAVRARISTRRFEPRAMPIDLLGRFLHYSQSPELLTAPLSNPHGPVAPLLHLYAFLWDVKTLAPGTYRYDPAPHALIWTGEAPSREKSSEWIFQPELAMGTGLLLLVGDIADAVAAFGQRGYRYLLMQAGLVGETAYLAGTSLGLGVCGNGGLRETTAQELGGFDGRTRDLLWSLAFGFPLRRRPTLGVIGT